jgi:hypothetical protein
MRSWVAGALLGSFGLLLSAGGGCGGSGKSSPPDACSAGEERCACYPNGTCNAGLSCLSNLCVRETGPADGAVDRASGTGGTGVGGGTGTGTGGSGTGGSPNGGAGGSGTGTGGAGGGGIGGSGIAGAGAGGTGKGGAGGIGGAAGGAGKGGAAGGAAKGGASGGGGKGGAAGAGSGGIGTGGTPTGGVVGTGGTGAGGAAGAGGAGGDPGCAVVQCPASVPNCCKDWFAFVFDQGTGLSRPDLVTYFSDTSSLVQATFNFENTNQFGAIGFDLTQEIDIYQMSIVEGLYTPMMTLPDISFETPTGDGSCIYDVEHGNGTYFLTTSPVFYPCNNNFSPGRAFKINFLVEPRYFTVQPGMGFGGVSVSSVAMIPF